MSADPCASGGQRPLKGEGSPAQEMVARSQFPSVRKIPNTRNPTIYQIQSDVSSISSPFIIKRCQTGHSARKSPAKKTILLLGSVGSGKSTLINGMANYIFQVSWKDNFRFRLVESSKEGQPIHSTQHVTVYEVHPTSGCSIDYALEIIDTPGFCEDKNQQFVNQILDLFSEKGGQSSIDAVCFVVKATLDKLSSAQKSVFESITSIFGKELGANIVVLVTFGDGNTPSVLRALESANISYTSHAVFNNSALFTDPNAETSKFSKRVWDLGMESFGDFFSHLKLLEERSLPSVTTTTKDS